MLRRVKNNACVWRWLCHCTPVQRWGLVGRFVSMHSDRLRLNRFRACGSSRKGIGLLAAPCPGWTRVPRVIELARATQASMRKPEGDFVILGLP